MGSEHADEKRCMIYGYGEEVLYFASIPGVLISRYLHGVSLKLSLGLHREMVLIMALDLAALHQNQHQRWKLSLCG